MGTTGENDTKAVERGLKSYFVSILKPVVDALLGVNVTYKSQDFRNISTALEVLKTFNLTDESLVSVENKQKIINQVFELPEDAKGDEVKQPLAVNSAPIPGAKTPQRDAVRA
jgi:hypothetical protein